MDISDKVALVTGASRGVGQQLAVGLAERGCSLILHARKKQNLQNTIALLDSFSIQVEQVEGLLDTEQEVLRLIHQIKKTGKNVDIIFNNAAVMEPFNEDFLSHNWETWTKTMTVNVMSIYTLCAAFLPEMKENGFGRIVNLTSGITNVAELAPYSSSKWAVRKLTEDLASKYVEDNIKINSLDPGWLRTDMGSQNAPNPVEDVLPGALVPILLEKDGVTGKVFEALDYRKTHKKRPD